MAYRFRSLVHYHHGRKHGSMKGRHGAREDAKNYTSSLAGNRERVTLCLAGAIETSKPQ